MVMIEMYDAAFELLEEAKHSVNKTKMTLCDLEDAMYDCYEASEDEKEDREPEESIEFRDRKSYRHDEHYGVHNDEDDKDLDMRYRRASRMRSGMRRNRMGHFV